MGSSPGGTGTPSAIFRGYPAKTPAKPALLGLGSGTESPAAPRRVGAGGASRLSGGVTYSLNQSSPFPRDPSRDIFPHVCRREPEQPGGWQPAHGPCGKVARLLGWSQSCAAGPLGGGQPCPALSRSQQHMAALSHCCDVLVGQLKRIALPLLPRSTSEEHGGVSRQPWLRPSTSQPQWGCVTRWTGQEMTQVQDGAAVVLPAQQLCLQGGLQGAQTVTPQCSQLGIAGQGQGVLAATAPASRETAEGCCLTCPPLEFPTTSGWLAFVAAFPTHRRVLGPHSGCSTKRRAAPRLPLHVSPHPLCPITQKRP